MIVLVEKVDGIVIVGDIYDWVVLSIDVVILFDYMLQVINIEYYLLIYVIVGNYDGVKCFNYGCEWLVYNNFYINMLLVEVFMFIEILMV